MIVQTADPADVGGDDPPAIAPLAAIGNVSEKFS
jgi:hypothetical protein